MKLKEMHSEVSGFGVLLQQGGVICSCCTLRNAFAVILHLRPHTTSSNVPLIIPTSLQYSLQQYSETRSTHDTSPDFKSQFTTCGHLSAHLPILRNNAQNPGAPLLSVLARAESILASVLDTALRSESHYIIRASDVRL